MRYLLYVSIFLSGTACSSAYKALQRTEADPLCIHKFRPAFTTALYATQVDVIGKHLSGILIIKTMPDSSVRIVFSNEAGFKFFDFGFEHNDFKVYYIFDQMDKKAVIKTLRKDFELVLMQHLDANKTYTAKKAETVYHVFPDGKDIYYYITNNACDSLIRMERGSKRKKVVEAFIKPGADNIPDSIGIKHHNFNFDIQLKRLQKDAEG
ncbi:MAG: hypothetical protein IT249_10240 [Chitinophagaceae bacterium]|nr:hypothetical protein [Chitinophagaceae bacterium]